MSECHDVLVAALVRMGIVDAGEQPTIVALTGGVSSEIYRIDSRRGTVCAKRALPRLRVAATWEVPVERNRYEREWLEVAGTIAAGAVPAVLAHDDDVGLFVMTYLPAATHPVWKAMLKDGRAEPAVAGAVGALVGRLHAATADDDAIAARFPTDALFEALRLEPYFGETGRAHPDLADRLDALHRRTAATRRVLLHGDVSPKNILIGPAGPVFVDAECATFGDPAFDLAFCANHLLLKCLWNPPAAPLLLECFDALTTTYLAAVDWEDRRDVEARSATLLPALLLARVDGKSPVEYLDNTGRATVRTVARRLLAGAEIPTLAEVRDRWRTEALV